MKPTISAISAVALLAILATGCSKSDDAKSNGTSPTSAVVTNPGTGGSTTCADFKTFTKSQQEAAITAMLKEEGKPATKSEITANRLSAVAFCKVSGKDSSVIRQINTG